MKLAPAEAKAIKFVLLLIALSAAARWLTRPRPVQLEQSMTPRVDLTAAAPAKPRKAAPSNINPNTASLADLDRLPGIGETTARKIIEGRPYHTLDDLARVIGRKRATGLASRILLPAGTPLPQRSAPGLPEQHSRDPERQEPAVSVNLNRASQTELEQLPGVGPQLARRILLARERAGGFRDWAQVDSVPGIGPALLRKLRLAGRL